MRACVHTLLHKPTYREGKGRFRKGNPEGCGRRGNGCWACGANSYQATGYTSIPVTKTQAPFCSVLLRVSHDYRSSELSLPSSHPGPQGSASAPAPLPPPAILPLPPVFPIKRNLPLKPQQASPHISLARTGSHGHSSTNYGSPGGQHFQTHRTLSVSQQGARGQHSRPEEKNYIVESHVVATVRQEIDETRWRSQAHAKRSQPAPCLLLSPGVGSAEWAPVESPLILVCPHNWLCLSSQRNF